jgi:tRNA(fMet)-specific endonuclease VapC
MPLRYMLDTDTSSYIMKRSHPNIVRRLQTVPVSDVCISVVTKAELLYGAEISPKRAQDETAVQGFLRHVEVLGLEDPAAAHHAEIRAALKNAGTMIGSNDLFIAAHARSLSLILVTSNTREFGRVSGLSMENWTLPMA